MSGRSPSQDLTRFISAFDPAVARQARAAVQAMRQRLPGAVELVYDNYNALAIAFSPTEKVSDIVFSIAVYPRWASLFFAQGAKLPDPTGRLKGSGSKVRHVVLERGPRTLDEPEVKALMKVALDRADPPFDRTQKNRTIIKSISGKQRPRRLTKPKR
jgi:hypothetical protein